MQHRNGSSTPLGLVCLPPSPVVAANSVMKIGRSYRKSKLLLGLVSCIPDAVKHPGNQQIQAVQTSVKIHCELKLSTRIWPTDSQGK